MLYCIYGNDTFRARRLLREIINALEKKNLKANFYHFTPDNVSEESVGQVIDGQGLFGEEYVVVFECLLGDTLKDFLLSRLDSMTSSKNIYIFLEETIEKPVLNRIRKYAQKVQKFNVLNESEVRKWISEEAKKKGIIISGDEMNILVSKFSGNLWALDRVLEVKALGGDLEKEEFLYDPFGLTNMFSVHQFRKAYVIFHNNLSGGVAAEEIFWKLWWQVKILLVVSNYNHKGLNNFQIKQKTGFHPFVIQKSLAALPRFSREELKKTWDELFSMWIDSRLGISDLSLRLEKLLLP